MSISVPSLKPLHDLIHPLVRALVGMVGRVSNGLELADCTLNVRLVLGLLRLQFAGGDVPAHQADNQNSSAEKPKAMFLENGNWDRELFFEFIHD